MQEKLPSTLAAALHIWVDVVLALCALAGVALIVSLAISPFHLARPGADGDGSVWVAIGTSPVLPMHRLELRAGDGEPPLTDPTLVKTYGELRFPTRRVGLVLLSFLPMLVVLAAVLVGGWQLRQVLATVARGEPFDAPNPRRIATIGWIIVGITALEPLLGFVPAAIVLRTIELEGISLSSPLMVDKDTLLVGLLVLLLSVVFREGARLHEEQSLTV